MTPWTVAHQAPLSVATPGSSVSGQQSYLHFFSFSSSWTHISSLPYPTSTQAGRCDALASETSVKMLCVISRLVHSVVSAQQCNTPDLYNDPGSTRGDDAFISLGPWLITGRDCKPTKPTHAGQMVRMRKKPHCALKPWDLRGCLLPWTNLAYPGWSWLIFLPSGGTDLRCRNASQQLCGWEKCTCFYVLKLIASFSLISCESSSPSPPFFLGAKFISDLFSLLNLYNSLFSKAIFSGSILPWRK